jgi:hypothetical protein
VESTGTQTARAIGWIYPQYGSLREMIRQGMRDCCSIEADVAGEQEGGRIVITDVLRGVGVVLGHTSKQTPGFAGARLQLLTEFGPEAVPGTEGPTGTAGGESGQGQSTPPAAGVVAPSTPTFSKDDLIAAIKAAGIQPGDVWPTPPAAPPAVPASIVPPVVLPPVVPAPAAQPAPAALDPLTDGNPFL